MDGKRVILENTFTKAYDSESFTQFIKEFFNNCTIVSKVYKDYWNWSEFAYYMNCYTHIGNYIDDNKNKIAIFSVELKKNRNVERARSMQRNFISKLLSKANYDAAIVAFYSEDEPKWRLSLVRLDYEFAKGRVKSKLTPAKRYSYLVGEKEPCHTAKERLLPIFENDKFNPTLNNIEEAFNVEKVTEEFFKKYREKYCELKDHLDESDDFNEEAEKHKFTSEQFAKKLMGQLAFLYFIQKKGWLGVKVLPHAINDKQYKNAYYNYNKSARRIVPEVYKQVSENSYKLNYEELKKLDDEDSDILAGCFKAEKWGSGEKSFIRHLFNNCKKLEEKEDKNFFDDYLEPLFYEALNHKRGDNNYYNKFNCKIPFLNGGLFEPLENYDWKNSTFELPNELFSNADIKGEENADGILDIFDRYNFTMNEDEPLEREVAVDPEMLGKIFENLLDVKDRKSKGAFYTPREIVHYMCQESLINYLVNETGIEYEEIKDFIIYGEIMKDEDTGKEVKLGTEQMQIPLSVYNNLKLIDDKLADVRIADPAVGSGAFPMGMISEIVKARNNITEYFVAQYSITKEMNDSEKKMKQSQRARIYESRNPYKLKRNIIKNSIYAVDIEASAVDITKLRIWLSLVVDEELEPTYDDIMSGFDKQKDPQALPNLDYNIMCGNSLIDEFEGIKLFDDSILDKKEHSLKSEISNWQMSLFNDNIEKLLEDLFKEQDRFYGEDDSKHKLEIKKNIEKIIDDMIRLKLANDNNSEGLAKYDGSLKAKTKPYFLWKLEFGKVFKDKGGFDIVIGNPPYLSYYGRFKAELLKEEEDFFKRNYKFISERNRRNDSKFVIGRFNSIMFFLERATHVLHDKGICSYIIDLTIHKNPSEDIRKYLIDNTRIIEIINNLAEFDNVGSGQTILSFKNAKSEDDYLINITDKHLNDKGQFYKKSQLNYSFESPSTTKANSILNKINMRKTGLLGEYFSNRLIRTGITFTGQKDKFLVIVDEKNKKPLIEGRKSIKYKYCKPKIINYINYDKKLLNELNKEYEEQLDKSKNKKQMWIGLGDEIVFKSPKIIITQTGTQITATYSEEDICLNLGLFSISNCNSYGDSSNYNLKYFLALLNSKLTTYYAIKENLIFIKKGATPQIRLKDIKLIPIFYDELKCEVVCRIVDEILRLTNADDYEECIDKQTKVKKLSDEIDAMVYEFYDLSPNEISIINNFEKENN